MAKVNFLASLQFLKFVSFTAAIRLHIAAVKSRGFDS
jgi:hypothetical protein